MDTVLELTARQKLIVQEALRNVQMAESALVARRVTYDMLVAALAPEETDGVSFDPQQGVFYRIHEPDAEEE